MSDGTGAGIALADFSTVCTGVDSIEYKSFQRLLFSGAAFR